MKRFIARMLALLMVFTLIFPALDVSAAETAATMRLVSAEGKVTVTNKNGKQIKISNNMRLYNAYGVTTSAKSYAYISLDNNKAVKLDAGTQVEIRKSGKKLEVHVLTGKIFCNVKAPLNKDEKLNITTSTTVTGVRGTSLCMSVLDDKIELQLYSGEVVTLVSGSGESLNLSAGQKLNLDGVSTPAMEKLGIGDIPGFVAVLIADNPDMAQIFQGINIDTLQLQENAADLLKQDEDSKGNQDVYFPPSTDSAPATPPSSGGSGSTSHRPNPMPPAPTGPGTPNSPFEVTTPADLLAIGTNTDGYEGWTLSACYKQTADINLSSMAWVPIGSESTPFTGTYDGDGKTISNLNITSSVTASSVGLFGSVGSGGMVKNLAVVDCNIVADITTGYAGGLAGRTNGGSITNCSVTGTVTASAATSYAGGLVGYAYGGSISNCYAGVDVTASGATANHAGGLVGYRHSDVTNCYATGAAIASNGTTNYAGGLVGRSQGNVKYCYATGDVTTSNGSNGSSDSYVGGVAGYNQGNVTNCYAMGNVSANETNETSERYAGGIVGYSFGSVINCYAIGNVSASNVDCKDNYVGGIVGDNNDNVTNCVALNESVTSAAISGNYVGRVVGDHGNVTNCYARQDMAGAAGGRGENIDGTAIPQTDWESASWWTNTPTGPGFSPAIWKMDGTLPPTLQNMPTIPALPPVIIN